MSQNNDLISRQDVIDALHTWFRDGFDEDKWWNSTHVLAAIEGLPSAQQGDKWETCFECPLSHGCPKIKGCTNEQAIEYASQIPNDCPLSAQPDHTADIGKKAEKEDCISRQAAIEALNEYFARIGKLKRRGLTKGEKAISLDTVEAIKNLPPVEAIPVSWIEAKIELVNDLPGVSMLKMKAADWVDLIKQWRAEQRNPEVDHDAQIRELAEEMQKHGVHKPSAAPSTAHTTDTTAETTAPSTDDWIPVERELPEDLAEVNVTWVNHEPEPYYEPIKSKPFTASAVYYEGNWYWYSSVCADVLAEYGRNDVDKVDDAIEITAWMPLPEPYWGGGKE